MGSGLVSLPVLLLNSKTKRCTTVEILYTLPFPFCRRVIPLNKIVFSIIRAHIGFWLCVEKAVKAFAQCCLLDLVEAG